jgi:competence protein ComEA
MKRTLAALVAAVLSAAAVAAVNINTASQAELEGLKGIGPVKAKAIIDYRQKHGPFKTVDALDNVKGIGKATVGTLRSELSVDGAAPTAKADAKPADSKPVDQKADKKAGKPDAKQ